MTSYRTIPLTAAALMLLGAGCAQNFLPTTQTPPLTTDQPQGRPPSGTAVATTQGFGRLPSLEMAANPASPKMMNGTAEIAIAPPQDGAVRAAAGVFGNSGTAPMMISPGRLPMPPEPTLPASVEYRLEAPMPSWSEQEDVWRSKHPVLPLSSISALATQSGIPSELLKSSTALRSFNASWNDQQGYAWNMDAGNGMVSFWHEENVLAQPQRDARSKTGDEKELLGIADRFLAERGFAKLPHGPGEVREPYADILRSSVQMPCIEPMMGAPTPGGAEAGISVSAPTMGTATQVNQAVVSSPVSATISTPPAASMMRPCWNRTILIGYPALQGNDAITNYDGSPFDRISLSIDPISKTVQSGNIWLAQELDHSAYQLLKKEEVEKRLKAGGRNPIWAWQAEGNSTVHLTSIRRAWLRYEAWEKEGGVAYLLPALVATGNVEYSKNRVEAYRTVVPLVADSAFGDDTPSPIKIMMPGSVPAQPAPESTMPPIAEPAIAPNSR